MEIRTTLEAAPAAPAMDTSIGAALPAVMVGDAAEVKREHEWPGNLFFVLSYVVAVGLGAAALGGLAFAVFSGEPWMAGVGLVAGAGAAVQWRLATEVEHFSSWGWYGAMVELAAAAAAKLWSMAQGNVVGGVIGLCIDLLWMRYFWERRDQFDVDLGN